MSCPVCGKFASKTFVTSVNDGGSTMCYACGSIYHKCISGYKIGSPGPALCPDCKPTNYNFVAGMR